MTATGTRTEHSATRPYDNSRRRRQAEATRARIVEAGADLLRRASIRDWSHVTIRAVADRAGVSERTVYRHFGSDKGLRDAVMGLAQERAGVDLAVLDLADLPDVAASVLRFAAEHPIAPEPDLDPTLTETDRQRREALLRAVADAAPDLDPAAQVRAAAVLDLVWSLSAHQRLRGAWGLDDDEAIATVQWAIALVTDALSRRDVGA